MSTLYMESVGGNSAQCKQRSDNILNTEKIKMVDETSVSTERNTISRTTEVI